MVHAKVLKMNWIWESLWTQPTGCPHVYHILGSVAALVSGFL